MKLRIPLLRRFWRDESAAMTVEFVIIFPMFMTILLASFEAGMLMTRYVMLDRALDITVRELRLGRMDNPEHDEIKQVICNHTVIMPHCMRDLRLELRPVSRTAWDVFDQPATCVDRTAEVQPAVIVYPGGSNELMLVRACAVFDPFFPTTPLGLQMRLDASGGYQMTAMAAFVNEPRPGGV